MRELVMIGDFETTVDMDTTKQRHTEVWASGLVEMYTENAIIHNCIEDTFEYLTKLKRNCIVYYHNLKFDGSFWLPFLLDKGYKCIAEEGAFLKGKDMDRCSFTHLISDVGIWYNIRICTRYGKIIELRDSLKLIPVSVEVMGKAYDTKHKKLKIEYKGERHAGGEITEEEEEYLKNDLYVVKEVLEIFYNEGHKSMTIGSCCYKEFKNLYPYGQWNLDFPNLAEYELDESYGSLNADEYIRKSYKGGWCYLKKGYENRMMYNGLTADVNSLYPSQMHSESGNAYPVGMPYFWKGEIPQRLFKQNKNNSYYFIRFRCSFQLKRGYLPTVQVKNDSRYRPNEWLHSSDIFMYGKRYKKYYDKDGVLRDNVVELTMTKTDWLLFNDHYIIDDLEILDGCWFYTSKGLFDTYINKYAEIKKREKGAKRNIAKLFLNNLYGKMATSCVSSFKVAYMQDNGVLGYMTIQARDKEPGYIPIGSAITSYARNFTIRHAQMNYDNFIYADTDSLHMVCNKESLVDIKVHPTNFNHWKLESYWDKAIFVRQKTYIEHVTHSDEVKLDKAYYDVKACGMPKSCKSILVDSLEHTPLDVIKTKYHFDWQIEFASTPRDMTDFKRGLSIYGKLMPVQVNGGTVLKETYFTMC